MQLTPRGFLLLLATAGWLAAGIWSPYLTALAGVWLLLVAALCAADWRLTPGPGEWELVRRHDSRLSLAAPNQVEVAVRLLRGLRPLPIWLRDEPPSAFRLEPDRPILQGRVAGGETEVLTYAVIPPRRGNFAFGDLHLRWESVLGLLRRQARFPAAAPVKVYPNLVDVHKYDLLLRKNRLWELGLRNTRLTGSGSEYERLREYSPDDEYRRINWKATARRGKPISVDYETERSQTIVVLLDIGRMMRSPVGDVAKLDYAINATLLLTFVAAQRGDKVGLLAFADQVQTWLAPRTGKSQFHRMLEQLYAVESQPVEPDYGMAFGYLASKQTRRSLVLVFSDLTGSTSVESLSAHLMNLRRRHLALLVTLGDPTVQRLARQEIVDSASLYQRTVAEQLLDERHAVLDQLQRRGVLTLDAPADELSLAVVNRYLALKARELI